MALIDLLKGAQRKVFTVEISPPANRQGMSVTVEMLEALREMSLDGLAVTNSTGGSYRLNPLIVVEEVRQVLKSIPIIIHMTARDEGSARTLYEHLDGMRDRNVSDILVLRGDPTPGNSRAVDAYKFSTVEMVEMISEYCSRDNFPIDIFVAGHPEYPENTLPKHLRYQKLKIERGARGMIANIVTDAARYQRYLEAAARLGIDVPVTPSVIPLVSLRRCQFLEDKLHIPVPDQVKEKLAKASKEDAAKIGTEISTRIAMELIEMGAPGINFNVIFPSDTEYVKQILREVRGYATIWEKYQIEDPGEKSYYDNLRSKGY